MWMCTYFFGGGDEEEVHIQRKNYAIVNFHYLSRLILCKIILNFGFVTEILNKLLGANEMENLTDHKRDCSEHNL
ncbi:hypothetical protein RJT34_25471 [Clitoria ternatea]|uniref:Uncharacterized protein n=1 Tax=Clitoria ternatea TaxID=43366 RepID=A0AAN9FPU4_CLITE